MRKRHASSVAPLLLLALAVSAPAPARGASPPAQLTLVYTADLGGHLEPCGCTVDQRGGLARMAAVLAGIRAEGHPVVFLGGGDLLFDGRPEGEERRQAISAARTAAEALRRMHLDATVAGERDAFLGAAFLAKLRLPLTDGRLLSAGATKVGFGPLGRVPSAAVRVAVLHEGGTRAGAARADEARRAGVTVLFTSHRANLLDDDVNRVLLDGPVPVVQVQGRGQSLARVDLFLRGDRSRAFEVLPAAAERDEELELLETRRVEYARRREAALAGQQAELAQALASKLDELAARAGALRSKPLPGPPLDRPSLRVSFIPLTQELPEDRAVHALLARHHEEVGRDNLARARAEARPCPPPAAGAATYIGTAEAPHGGVSSCKGCHPEAVAQWETTKHARAWATLVKGGRTHDLECVSCHVTGWREPGGACSVAATEGRRDVQCESCHGPASLHAFDPPGHIVRAPGEERCRTCHTPEHSTRFEPTSFFKRVIGPGHGDGLRGPPRPP
ncbi:MAG TPA: multiheme c-type cytochrome [Anaeromyxobacteraceae bacterium]|nr:multiheme c-type cytochrome [Anaeromyxobacteraceae bacterium]